ncbi:glycosyltransferase [Microbacterium ureisolvens]|uniref:glycosyltransferase n=1 Tax=Microbacterium ureisolvens TaxID=2781186 RepID=UPI00362DBA78
MVTILASNARPPEGYEVESRSLVRRPALRHHGDMARFLLTAMPFTGHVTPLRAVAQALVARGHDVRFYTGEAFRAGVEASAPSSSRGASPRTSTRTICVRPFRDFRGERVCGRSSSTCKTS